MCNRFNRYTSVFFWLLYVKICVVVYHQVFAGDLVMQMHRSRASEPHLETKAQRAIIAQSKKTVDANIPLLRNAADQSGAEGVLALIDPQNRSIPYVLPGRSPLNAWIEYVSKNVKAPIDKMPLC